MAVPPVDMLMYLKFVLPADEHDNTWCDETAFAILCIEQLANQPKSSMRPEEASVPTSIFSSTDANVSGARHI